MAKRANRLGFVVLTVVAVVVAFVIAVPLVISSDAVKRSIVDQVTYLTGRNFSFRGEPSISLYPYLTVRLSDATLANADGMGDEPFIEMETMTGKLEILPLFWGQLDFARFRFINPRINLRTDADGRGNWIMDQGAIGSQVSKGDKEGVVDEAAPPSPLADIKVGRFDIRDGIVTYHDERNGRTEEFSKVDLKFNWTSTTQAASGAGTFIWRGEPVEFDGGIDAPLDLLSGSGSPMRFALTATPIELMFAGKALQFGGTQLEGEITLNTPSVRRVVEWLGGSTGSGAILGPGSISGKINWLGPSVNISEASFALDGNEGEGALSATIDDGASSFQGTLAFEALDLTPYLEAIQGATAAWTDSWQSMPLGAPLDHVSELDLRISASEVTAGSLSISNAAATAILDEQQLVVTIGEAEIDGGSAEARLTLETVDGALSGTTDIELADVALGDLLEAIPLPPAISGSTTVTLHATGAGRTLGEFAEALTGEAQIAIADGVLDGVDLTALPAILSDPDADAMEGSTAFAAAACTVAIADGQMTTEALEAEGDGFSVHMNGSVGLLEPTIAGRGVVSLAESDAAPEEVPFLIDGTWQHLRLLPDLGPPVERTDIAPEPGDPAPVSSEEPAN